MRRGQEQEMALRKKIRCRAGNKLLSEEEACLQLVTNARGLGVDLPSLPNPRVSLVAD